MSRTRGPGNHEKKLTNNSKDSEVSTSDSNELELKLVMAANNTLQTWDQPSWFSTEMKKFAATIQTSITTWLHQVDAALEKISEAIPTTKTKITALEAKWSECETTTVDLRYGLTELERRQQKETTALRDKLDDYENRQQKSESCGIPVGSRMS